MREGMVYELTLALAVAVGEVVEEALAGQEGMVSAVVLV